MLTRLAAITAPLILGLTLSFPTTAAPQSTRAPDPQLLVVHRGDARVYILGFGEARDTSWFTPKIRSAFDRSSQLWLETAPPTPPERQTPEERKAFAERSQRLSYNSSGTLFDALEPSVRERVRAYIADLGINNDSIQMLRPWKAYYSIVFAFWSTQKAEDHAVNVDAVLRSMAEKSGMTIGYEFPSADASLTFFSSMPNDAASQYIEWMLDFLDDYKRGHNDEGEQLSWIAGERGNGPTRSLDRMRTKQPALYQIMQPKRNGWWAEKVDELLRNKGTYFIAVGQLHVLGPDGIPAQLAKRGLKVELVH